jgi:ribosomal-protein-serine acetyltransferase
MFKILVDKEVELALLDFFHAEELFKLIIENDKYLRVWLPWLDNNQTLESMKTFIASTKKKFSENNGFEVVINYNNQIAGILGVHPIDWANKKTSIGYWVSESFQGNGLVTKSCKSVLDCLFNKYNLNRIEIECGIENKKSRAIPERLGFVQEGIKRENEWLYDHYVDSIVYSMLKRDWDKR